MDSSPKLTDPTRPIYTHQKKGATKSGLHASDRAQHAIIHDANIEPDLIRLDHENGIHPARIAVNMVKGETLHATSRLRFNYACTVEYDWRVQDLGMVCDVEAVAENFVKALMQPQGGAGEFEQQELADIVPLYKAFGQALLASDGPPAKPNYVPDDKEWPPLGRPPC